MSQADLDRYSFTAEYHNLPRMGLDTSYKTFSLRTEISQNAAYMLRNEMPEERVTISGWRKLPSNAHIAVTVNMEDIVIADSDVKEKIQIIKDKKGNPVAKKYSYYTEIAYTFDSRFKVSDFRGNQLVSDVLSARNDIRIYRTKDFGSREEALAAFISNIYIVTTSITSLEVNRSMNELNTILNDNFGYTSMTVGDNLWILDSKKHPEYRAHRQAWAAFNQAMYNMSADQPLDEVREMMEPVIRYFESLKRIYTSNSKADRKIRYASYYNLAKIYYYLDEPDASMYEAGQLMINNYDEKDGGILQAAAADLKNQFNLNRINTRHFFIDIEQLEGPSLVKAVN